ncbi:MAG: hypothetical protein CR982_04410 [Candidatus Cloacimonadota bacterium]|nr:MAG: hypothetical protein CR982_04410 [Candidatus Cloacimonadota bacterium]PIE79475.1 MAG: hypothetical protein CSA15_02960 [Candidatus Delongbacteria bacterium]
MGKNDNLNDKSEVLEIIEKADKPFLLKLLKEYADVNSEFRNFLKFRIAETFAQNFIEKYRKDISNAAKKHFTISVGDLDIYEYTSVLNDVIERAEFFFDKNKIDEGIEVSIIVLESLPEALNVAEKSKFTVYSVENLVDIYQDVMYLLIEESDSFNKQQIDRVINFLEEKINSKKTIGFGIEKILKTTLSKISK